MSIETKFCPNKHTDLDAIGSIHLDSKAQMEAFGNYQGYLPNLKKLFLHNFNSHVWHFHIHAKFPVHPALEEIKIIGYSFTKKLPVFISEAKQVQQLSLIGCGLQHFPKEILQFSSLEYLDLSCNNITEFPDELFKLPNLKMLGIGGGTFTHLHWKKILKQIANAPQITHLKMSCSSYYSEVITEVAQIKRLEIWEDSFNYEDVDYASLDLPKLNAVEFFVLLRQLPKLEEVAIHVHHLPNQVLQHVAQIETLQTLKILNPAYGFIFDNSLWGNFKQLRKLYINGWDEKIPDTIEQMQNLEELHLYDTNLQNLHISASLSKLHTLTFNFSNKSHVKAFQGVSTDFLKLIPQLKKLETDDFPMGASIKQIKDLQKIFQMLPNHIPLILALVCREASNHFPISDLFELLPCKEAQTGDLAWQEIENRLNISLPDLSKTKNFYLLGKPAKTELTDIKNYFEQLQLTEVKKLNDAQCVVICRNMKKFPDGLDLKNCITEKNLLSWLEKQSGFERLDDSESENVALLLKSNDTSNISLGLELIQKTYLSNPQVDACLIALGLFSPDKTMKDTVKKFIKKSLSNNLLTTFSKVNRKGWDNQRTAYQAFKNHPELDNLTFAEVCFKCFSNEKYAYSRLGTYEILGLGGDYLSDAISAMEYYTNSIRIPKEITQLHPDFSNQVPKNISEAECFSTSPEVFSALFNVNHLSSLLLENNEDSIPDSIGNLVNLKKLELRMPSVIQIPVSIGQLTKLQVLEFNNDELEYLPDEFRPCKTVSNLTLGFEKLKALPSWLSEWRTLSELSLWHSNNIEDIDVIFKIHKLKKLSISYCNLHQLKLTSTPKKSDNLTELMVDSSEDIKDAESVVSVFLEAYGAGLKKVKFQIPSLTKLPQTIAQCTQLETLNLINCRLTEIPEAITKTSIKELILANNALTELPDFLMQMPTLRKIELPQQFKKQQSQLEKTYPKINFTFW